MEGNPEIRDELDLMVSRKKIWYTIRFSLHVQNFTTSTYMTKTIVYRSYRLLHVRTMHRMGEGARGSIVLPILIIMGPKTSLYALAS